MKVETFLCGMAGLTVALALAWTGASAAYPGAESPPGKNPPARLKSVPGSPVKRVILTQKAAERLGIEMGKVSEQPIARKRMVGGLVVSPVQSQSHPKMMGGAFGGFAPTVHAPARATAPSKAVASGDAWVRVALTRDEWESIVKDQPARILPLTTRGESGKGLLAQPSGIPPREDVKRSMLQLYYVVPGKKHGLMLNQRMRVELEQAGNGENRKVVPYGAVYYDAKGITWVYVNPEPLGFERKRVRIERVVGNVALLEEGPPVGTAVVTVGAAMLYGVEVYGK